MSITNATLAQQMNDLLVFFDGREEELQAWMSGAVGGGTALDGKFPLTDRLGNTRQSTSPAQLEDDVSGLVVSAGVSATAASASAAAASASAAAAAADETLSITHRDNSLAAQVAAEAAQSAAENAAVSALANRILTDTNAANALASEIAAAASAAAALISEDAAAASAVLAATFDPNDYLALAGTSLMVANAIINAPATGTVTFGDAGGLVSSNPFWNTFHFGAKDVLTEVGVNKFPRFALYWSYTTATDPTDLRFNLATGNAGTLPAGINLATVNGGLVTVNGTAVSLLGHTHTIANTTDLQTALDAKLALTGGAVSGVLEATNQFKLGARTRHYSAGTSATVTADTLTKIGEFTFLGPSENLSFRGQLRLQTGNSGGTKDFILLVRSNTLPSKSFKLTQSGQNMGVLIPTIRAFHDETSGRVVLAWECATTIQNWGWIIDVVERGNYNYFEPETVTTTLATAGLTEITSGSHTFSFDPNTTYSVGSTPISLEGHTHDHGAITGLADDDHPQYAGIAQSETITGVWTFSSAQPEFRFEETDVTDHRSRFVVSAGSLYIQNGGATFGGNVPTIIGFINAEKQSAYFYPHAGVELRFNNAKKFETTAAGATVTGTLEATAGLTVGGVAASLAGHTHAIADTTGLQAALDLKAPLNVPSFTGGITSTAVSAWQAAVVVKSDAVASNWARLDFWNVNAAERGMIYLNNTSDFVIRNDKALGPILFLQNSVERARIDASGNLSVAGGATIGTTLSMSGSSSRDKLRVWSSGTYTIGMGSGYTFGSLTDFAMTFQMNNTAGRGWWWGTGTHTNAQGAMALTNTGKLHVGDTLNAVGAITQNDVQVSLDGHTHSYLPLTGGTLTGTLDVNSEITSLGHIRSRAESASERRLVASNTIGAVSLLVNTSGHGRISQLSAAYAWEKNWIEMTRDGAVALNHNGSGRLRTLLHTASASAAGAEVMDKGSAWRPVGYLDAKRLDVTAARTLQDTDFGKVLRKDGTARTLTINSITTIPQDVMVTLINGYTGSPSAWTITRGAGVSLRWYRADGTISDANRTIAGGGVVTIYKIDNATYCIWGSGIS